MASTGRILGILSGGTGNCTAGGTTYYQPIAEVLAALGLQHPLTGREDQNPIRVRRPPPSLRAAVAAPPGQNGLMVERLVYPQLGW